MGALLDTTDSYACDDFEVRLPFAPEDDRVDLIAASGQVNMFGPLSVVNKTMVLSLTPSSSSFCSSLPTF